MKKFLCYCFSLMLLLGAVLTVPFSELKSASAEEYVSLYSKTNAPLFNGVTGKKLIKM